MECCSEKITENTMSHLYFNEESEYSEENTEKHLCQSLFFNKVACLRQLFLQKNSRRLLLECRHCKNKTREIDCLCCKEVDAMLTASAKISEHEGSMSPSSLYGYLHNY